MNNKIVAFVAVAALCIAAAAVVVYYADSKDNNDGPVSIVDGSGTTIALDEPLTGTITLGTNILKAMKVLGLTSELKGLSFYTSSSATDQSNWDTYSPWFPDATHMSTAQTMTAEQIMTVCKYIICPVSSMTLSTSQITSFNEMGITVIKLDCYGDTALEDIEKLTILFGQKKPTMDAYNNYLSTSKGVTDAVKGKVRNAVSSDNDTFLYYLDSGTFFYNQTSEGSLMIEQIYGKNALRNIAGLDTSGVSNTANSNLAEVLVAEDAKNSIDKIFIRSTSPATESAAVAVWNNCLLNTDALYCTLSQISASGTNEIYVFNSNVMSGMLSYVGWIVIAEVCGIDTGYDVADLIQDYNDKYGFTEPTSGYAFHITITGGTASAVKLF